MGWTAEAEVLEELGWFAMTRTKLEELIAYFSTQESRALSHADLEREVMGRGRELLRMLLQEQLDSRGSGAADGPVRGADGVERRRERDQERTLTTIVGDVKVRRKGYGQSGVQSLHPRDAELNLPCEQYSLEMRHQVAEEAAKLSFQEVTSSVQKRTGVRVGKRQAEELVQRAATDVESFYRERRQTASPSEPRDSLVVIQADGKGVVMRRQDLRPATRKVAEAHSEQGRRKRLSKGQKRNRKRMATVATVYTVAPFERRVEAVAAEMAPVRAAAKGPRPKPQGKRVWASLEQEPEEVLAEAFEEAHSRDPAHEKKWVALVDGNKTQLKILHTQARRRDIELTIVLDVMHVVEYLWKAAHAFFAEGSKELEPWVGERLRGILAGRVSSVAAAMRRSATRRRLRASKRAAVDACADYLLGYKQYLRYDRYLAEGFPIATGVIEGACRHLVKDRMDVTGARWSLGGGEAVLKLRALRSSGDFDEYWAYHERKEFERNHVARYAGGDIPSTKKPEAGAEGATLRLVK